MKTKILAATVFAAGGAFALNGPASAQFSGPNPPGIQSPGCAGDCSPAGFGVPSGSWSENARAYITERRIRSGVTAFKARNYDRAAHYLTLALEDRPQETRLSYLTGAAHYFDGERSLAREHLTKALAQSGSLDESQRTLAQRMLADVSED